MKTKKNEPLYLVVDASSNDLAKLAGELIYSRDIWFNIDDYNRTFEDVSDKDEIIENVRSFCMRNGFKPLYIMRSLNKWYIANVDEYEKNNDDLDGHLYGDYYDFRKSKPISINEFNYEYIDLIPKKHK